MSILKQLSFLVVILAVICLVTPTVADVLRPPWITEADATCCVFERYPNRTFTDFVEYGQTTDFYEPWECARWCCWVEDCYAFEWIYHIDTTYGGCYDVYKPCCRVFTYAWPWMGTPSFHDVRDTAYLAWAPAPYGFTCDPTTVTCDATGFVPGYTGGPSYDAISERADQMTESQVASRPAGSIQAAAPDNLN